MQLYRSSSLPHPQANPHLKAFFATYFPSHKVGTLWQALFTAHLPSGCCFGLVGYAGLDLSWLDAGLMNGSPLSRGIPGLDEAVAALIS
jgi:hypothetical protein